MHTFLQEHLPVCQQLGITKDDSNIELQDSGSLWNCIVKRTIILLSWSNAFRGNLVQDPNILSALPTGKSENTNFRNGGKGLQQELSPPTTSDSQMNGGQPVRKARVRAVSGPLRVCESHESYWFFGWGPTTHQVLQVCFCDLA